MKQIIQYFWRGVSLVAVLMTLLVLPTLTQRSQANLPKGVVLKEGDVFEYIVVGAGAAGAAAAARLALAGAAVLLVEAGGDPDPLSWIPSFAQSLLGSSWDWQYPTLPNGRSCLSFRGSSCRASRGRALGGSTAINNMMHVRGHPHDWDSLNIIGWTWEDMKSYFLRFEGLQDLNYQPISSNPFHNISGPMKLQLFVDSANPWHSRTIEGYLRLNFPYNSDVNAKSQIGVTQVVGYVYNGERMSTARGYLSRSDVKKKLKVAKFTRCVKVIIDDNEAAKGVTVVTRNRMLNLYASREVILSAGALSTPQILMLSGIGHADHLNSLNIPVGVDLPVGDDLTDHQLPLIFIQVDSDNRAAKSWTSTVDTVDAFAQFLESGDGPLASIGLGDVVAFANTLCYNFQNRYLVSNSTECELPSTQIIHAFIPQGILTGPSLVQQASNLNNNVMRQLSKINANHPLLLISPIILQTESKGHVRLASNNPLDMPEIFPNLLSGGGDIEEILRAVGIIEDLTQTRPFKQHNARIVKLQLEGCPTSGSVSGYWRCYARHLTQTIYHSVGSTALGRVVDETLKVFGIRGLRVADLGVLPRLVRGNTAAAAIAIGERVVDFLLDNYH